MDVREGTSGTSADVPGRRSQSQMKDESKDYNCQKILRVGKKNMEKKG